MEIFEKYELQIKQEKEIIYSIVAAIRGKQQHAINANSLPYFWVQFSKQLGTNQTQGIYQTFKLVLIQDSPNLTLLRKNKTKKTTETLIISFSMSYR